MPGTLKCRFLARVCLVVKCGATVLLSGIGWIALFVASITGMACFLSRFDIDDDSLRFVTENTANVERCVEVLGIPKRLWKLGDGSYLMDYGKISLGNNRLDGALRPPHHHDDIPVTESGNIQRRRP